MFLLFILLALLMHILLIVVLVFFYCCYWVVFIFALLSAKFVNRRNLLPITVLSLAIKWNAAVSISNKLKKNKLIAADLLFPKFSCLVCFISWLCRSWCVPLRWYASGQLLVRRGLLRCYVVVNIVVVVVPAFPRQHGERPERDVLRHSGVSLFLRLAAHELGLSALGRQEDDPAESDDIGDKHA